MSEGKERIAEASPRVTARLAGFSWSMTFLTGGLALVVGGRFVVAGNAAATAAGILAHEPQFRLGIAANLIATAFYVAATLFVYELLKPVSRKLSLLAAFFSLVGCAIGAVGAYSQLDPLAVLKGAQTLSVFSAEQLQALAFMVLRMSSQAANPSFLFFGLHCFLVGCLILRSTFLPRLVGALMVLAGLGWLTFCMASLLSPPLARHLFPYIMIPGMLGEGSLALWLLVMGVNGERWEEQAGTRPARIATAAPVSGG